LFCAYSYFSLICHALEVLETRSELGPAAVFLDTLYAYVVKTKKEFLS